MLLPNCGLKLDLCNSREIQRTGAQIVFSFLIFKSVDKANYGTAIGIFYLVSGLGIMLSSFISGYLAKEHFSSVFMLSGVFSFLALGLSARLLNANLLNGLKKLAQNPA